MNSATRSTARTGFTLVELLVVIAILGILAALLMPAVQMAREAGRKATCANNMKQLGVALVQYDSTYRKFPYGNLQFGSNGPQAYGSTWWVRILPYLEEGNVADNYDWQDPAMGELPNNTHNFALLRNFEIAVMTCPSSPLPKTATVPAAGSVAAGPVQMPHYAGVAGSAVGDDIVTSGETVKSFDGILTDVLVSGSGTLTGVSPANSTGGFQVGRDIIRDGLSSTMIVAESSGWCVDAAGNQVDARVQGSGHLGVFVTGASGANITDSNITVMYGVGHDRFNNVAQRNPNAPINSTHRDGANVLMAGGSVHFLTTGTDLDILLQLADRDDGGSGVDVGSL